MIPLWPPVWIFPRYYRKPFCPKYNLRAKPSWSEGFLLFILWFKQICIFHMHCFCRLFQSYPAIRSQIPKKNFHSIALPFNAFSHISISISKEKYCVFSILHSRIEYIFYFQKVIKHYYYCQIYWLRPTAMIFSKHINITGG